jgi:hypothetical protein
MINDNIKVTGQVSLTLIGPDGNVKDTREDHNLVVTGGKGVIADRMKGTPTIGAMTYMGVGSGTVAAALGDTDITVLGSRVLLDSTTVAGAVITYVCTFVAGAGTGAVTEAGIFNGSTAGTMLARVMFPVVNKAAGDTMVITWTITIS